MTPVGVVVALIIVAEDLSAPLGRPLKQQQSLTPS